MDKYTVDLDKVLNDFEYSELTDQYSSSKINTDDLSSFEEDLSEIHHVTPHTSAYKNSNAKHSINNVFQSLNDYLNTEIGSTEQGYESDTESSQNLTIEVEKNNYLTVLEKPVSKSDLKEFINNDLSCKKIFSLKTDEDNTSKSLNVYDNDSSQKDDIHFIDYQTTGDNTEKLLEIINFSNNLLINDEAERMEKSDKDSINISCFAKEEVQSDINLEIKSNLLDKDSAEEILNVEVDNDEKTEKKNEIKKVISFDNVNIDQKELEEYLNELEEECEDLNDINTKEAQNGSTVEIKEMDAITSNLIVLIEEKDCVNSVDISKNHKVSENLDEFHESGNGIEEANKNIMKVDKKEPKEEDCTVMESKHLVEGLPKTAKKDSKTELQEANVTKQIEIEVPRRPSILEVKSVMEDQSAKVNAVGKPGSTPYEFKQFESNEVVESDIDDSSPSPSPTFSDVSTVSSATTATIDSCSNSLEQNVSNNPARAQDVIENNKEETEEKNTVEIVPSLCLDVQTNSDPVNNSAIGPDSWLGKQAPLWIPDSDALNCLHCDMKFTLIKRRHHCRACGLVLCSKCCNLHYRLDYLDSEARVCNKCYEILTRENEASSGSETNSPSHNHGSQVNPNPNNPMEYCSMVPPMQQVSTSSQNPPSVMVPVSVLKRKGSNKVRKNKSVMFCDGIRPGSELTNLDNDFNYSNSKPESKKVLASPPPKSGKNIPEIDLITKCFIPAGENELPPLVHTFKSDISYKEQVNDENLFKLLKEDTLTFAIQKNLYVNVRLIDMSCCVNKFAWCFSTEGLITVGQDEIIILLEYLEDEKVVPRDVLLHLNDIYMDAKKGSSISELGVSLNQSALLGSKNHAGFLYIRPTHQCLRNIITPKEPYLIGILIHRWEIPWAKIFPLRLILRLGAEYKYYPTPIISTRHRESVYVEIGHTIMTLLADFRNFSYTLPNIRGLIIQMEDKITTVTIPSNRYDQVMKSINNSSEHILAFGGNFSPKADAHLVCVQDTQGKNENNYSTLTISIQNRTIKVTGVSFIVFNGNLKSSSGLTAKSGVVEDGLMIQIPLEKMEKLREDLRNMKNHTINCGQLNAPTEETVKIIWGENDVNFNVGVISPIDNESLSGVPSIRVHNGKDYVCSSGNRLIRWTEVFILQNGDENCRGQDVDYSKISENIAKATCQALVKYLDLLSSNNFQKIGIRTNLHTENVSYSAGSNGIKLPPIYMKSLDNELIPILLRITSNNWGDSMVVLELIFRVLNL